MTPFSLLSGFALVISVIGFALVLLVTPWGLVLDVIGFVILALLHQESKRRERDD